MIGTFFVDVWVLRSDVSLFSLSSSRLGKGPLCLLRVHTDFWCDELGEGGENGTPGRTGRSSCMKSLQTP